MTAYWGALCVGVGTLIGYLSGQALIGWLDRHDDEG